MRIGQIIQNDPLSDKPTCCGGVFVLRGGVFVLRAGGEATAKRSVAGWKVTEMS